MKKNYKIHLWIESENIEYLKKEAILLNMNLSELCRQKLKPNHNLIKIELILENILRKLEQNGN